jgi:hypothetical protein
MPCPYFEPQTVEASPQHGNARLPLIEEYDGTCHAAAEPFAAPQEQRFGCCNHGYSHARCGHFPASETRSAFRYTVLKDSEKVLEIICIEERDYTPVRWHPARYLPESGTFEGEIADACMRAQALAFCRSYTERFRLRT